MVEAIVRHLKSESHIANRGVKHRCVKQSMITDFFDGKNCNGIPDDVCFDSNTTLEDFDPRCRSKARICYGYYPSDPIDGNAIAARFVHSQRSNFSTLNIATGTVTLLKLGKYFTVHY
jgi:hypothetical protein